MGEESASQLENSCLSPGSLLEELSKAGVLVLKKEERVISDKLMLDLYVGRPVDDELFEELYVKSRRNGLMIFQLKYGDEYIIRATCVEEPRERRALQIALASTAVATVFLTMYGYTQEYYRILRAPIPTTTLVWLSMAFTAMFMVTLLIHEVGHLLIAKSYLVPVAGPYIIPAPPIQLGFIGTFGAVIFMKGLPPSRKSQALLGLMGPLMGFMAALCMGFLGVGLSKHISIDEARELVSSGEASPIMFYPLAISILESFKGISEGYVLVYHPLAFFSLIMFVITFLNLMPVGQLDGGHVIRAFVDSRTYRFIEHLTVLTLFTAGLTLFLNGRYGGLIYVSSSFILLFLKAIMGFRPHPGPANTASLMKARHSAILLAYGALLALTAPIPI